MSLVRKFASITALSLVLAGCAGQQSRSAYATADDGLALDRVVLYRNGVGYFERKGEVDGDMLRIRVRKDQINDLLKSLTIVDRKSGKAVSVSMPLDPQTWANAALSTLAPGRGSIAEVLDSLRGHDVELNTIDGSAVGRVVMVERIEEEPDPTMAPAKKGNGATSFGVDHKVTLMKEQKLEVIRLSKVTGFTITDGDLAMQFHRRLDATAGEGMFQQVDVAIRLVGASSHDLVVSYVVAAPMWKPTYRVVLPKDGKGDALLQAWAVVDNTSGEDWRDVRLGLAAGAPIAFKYDLHTPRNVHRDDLSRTMVSKRARVAMGETSFGGEDEDDDYADKSAEPNEAAGGKRRFGSGGDGKPMDALAVGEVSGRSRPRPRKDSRGPRSATKGRPRGGAAKTEGADGYYRYEPETEEQAIDLKSLQRSTLARARSKQASGVTQFDLGNPVTVPDGSATMVAIINQAVKGEETFLFKPGGAGQGYGSNPYRVVRFKNTTPFVLESGPISIFSGGSFVGEGISETVGAGTSVTVPFAVETDISVEQTTKGTPEEIRLLKIVRGVMHVERFHQRKTIWKVRSRSKKDGFRVYVRHPRMGATYKLKSRPPETEDLVNAYLVPVNVPKGKTSAEVELIEQSPSRTTITIWDGRVIPMLQRVMATGNLDAATRAKLKPVIALRQEVGKIDTKLQGLRREQQRLNRRVQLHQRTLATLREDKSVEAAKMRREAAKAIDEFGKQGDEIARKMAKLERDRLRANVKLEEILENLTLKVAD